MWNTTDIPWEIKDMKEPLRVFTRKIHGCHGLYYWERLVKLGLYSIQRRNESYYRVYMWKVLNGLVSNFGVMKMDFNESLGTLNQVLNCRGNVKRFKTLKEGSLGTEGALLFNSIPRSLRAPRIVSRLTLTIS